MLASQKQLENKYKQAQATSDDWYRRAQLALQKVGLEESPVPSSARSHQRDGTPNASVLSQPALKCLRRGARSNPAGPPHQLCYHVITLSRVCLRGSRPSGPTIAVCATALTLRQPYLPFQGDEELAREALKRRSSYQVRTGAV